MTTAQQKKTAPYGYRVFLSMTMLLITALPLTELSFAAYLSAAYRKKLWQWLLGAGVSGLAMGKLLRRTIQKGKNPQGFLGAGVLSWLAGLLGLLAGCSLLGLGICLALCLLGAELSLGAARRMKGDLGRVLGFAWTQNEAGETHARNSQRLKLALEVSQLIVAGGMVLLWARPVSFSAWMTVPALALVLAAGALALLFPLTNLQLMKLEKYMLLQAEGQENKALHALLEKAIMKKQIKPYGVRLIMLVLRPFCIHRIQGQEALKLDADVPCIFVCNHGEIYGPMITKLFLPYPFRPWVTYEMVDRRIVADRMCNGIWKDIRFLPRKLVWFVADKLAAPLLAWIMRSVDSIPVYHDNPRQLMQTFRETTAAMEAGDNILIFPENAATSADGRYQREGVSEFFTGFTMAGQLYYNKTGHAPLFVPMYADKKKRVISIGVPTRYNPDLPTNEEKERLCVYLRGEMLKLAQR